MNNFCQVLTDFLKSKFEIEVEVFVSKKKEAVHMSLMKPQLSYEFCNDMIRFIRKFWNWRQKFYPGYFFVYPKLKQSIKWRGGLITSLLITIDIN